MPTTSSRRDISPWLTDYDAHVAAFDWSEAWRDLGGPPDATSGVNIADLAVDRHVRAGEGDRVALRWFGRQDRPQDPPTDISYACLAVRTNRFAGALRAFGFGPGTGVATLAGRVPELYVAALGALKAGCVYSPLFSAFGPDPIAQRIELGRIEVLVTTPTQLRRKVARMLDRLPSLRLVVVAGATEDDLGAMLHRAGETAPRVVS